jgi:hypothetical protein
MDDHTLLILIAVFVGLSALAMLIQAATLLGLFLVARELKAKILPLLSPVSNILDTSKRTLANVEGHIDRIGNQSGAILDVTKQQLAKVDELLSDASTRAKVQMERAEMVMDDAMSRVTQTVSTVQSGVIRPVREIQGVVAGIRTTFAHLGKSGRATVDHATSDEEMFI